MQIELSLRSLSPHLQERLNTLDFDAGLQNGMMLFLKKTASLIRI